MKIHEDIMIKYKYVIEQQPAVKPLSEWIREQTLNANVNKVLNNERMILISPILQGINGKYNYLYLILDIDVKGEITTSNLKRGLEISQEIINNNPNDIIPFYSGKNLYHLHYMKLIRYPNDMNLMDIKIKISGMIPYTMIDYDTSIKDNPIVTLGFRPDTNKCAVPIYDKFQLNDKKYIVDDMKDWMNTTDYKNIIRKLIPTEYIDIENIGASRWILK